MLIPANKKCLLHVFEHDSSIILIQSFCSSRILLCIVVVMLSIGKYLRHMYFGLHAKVFSATGCFASSSTTTTHAKVKGQRPCIKNYFVTYLATNKGRTTQKQSSSSKSSNCRLRLQGRPVPVVVSQTHHKKPATLTYQYTVVSSTLLITIAAAGPRHHHHHHHCICNTELVLV